MIICGCHPSSLRVYGWRIAYDPLGEHSRALIWKGIWKERRKGKRHKGEEERKGRRRKHKKLVDNQEEEEEGRSHGGLGGCEEGAHHSA